MRAWARAEMRRHDARHILEAGVAMSNYHARWVDQIDVPTAVLVTTQDRAVNPFAQFRMALRIPGAAIHRIDDGHVGVRQAELRSGHRRRRRLGGGAHRLTDGAGPAPSTAPHTGPLRGTKVVELAGIGPGPFCGLVLSDLGADVVRLDRAGAVAAADPAYAPGNVLDRGRRSVGIDLKDPAGVALALDLVAGADALIEGFRPGVAERLGVGPADCHARNPRLVYGRMTGLGSGGTARRSGGPRHRLHRPGRGARRVRPRRRSAGRRRSTSSATSAAVGCSSPSGWSPRLFEVARGGEGQVVDAAMVDGTALLLAPFYAAATMGFWGPRGTNVLDSGAPFYDSYQCADGGWVAVGALEPQFYAALLEGLGLDAAGVPDRDDRTSWPALRACFESTLRRSHPRRMGGDVRRAAMPASRRCSVSPRRRRTRTTSPEAPSPRSPAPCTRARPPASPAPPPRIARRPCYPGEHTDEVLAEWGIAADRVAALAADSVIAQHPASA